MFVHAREFGYNNIDMSTVADFTSIGRYSSCADYVTVDSPCLHDFDVLANFVNTQNADHSGWDVMTFVDFDTPLDVSQLVTCTGFRKLFSQLFLNIGCFQGLPCKRSPYARRHSWALVFCLG